MSSLFPLILEGVFSNDFTSLLFPECCLSTADRAVIYDL